MKKKNIPTPKFAHGACICGDKIVIASGVSELTIDMGMRMVPIGEESCYSFDYYKNTWTQLPDVPIGKLHPTLTVINSRYIF